MQRAFLAVAAAVVLGACASTKWSKQGGTGEALADDQLKCEMLASMRCPNRYSWGACHSSAYFECMDVRGWKKE